VITIPASQAGTSVVSVKDSSNTNAPAHATGTDHFIVINPSIKLSPTFGAKNIKLKVNGTGFADSQPVFYQGCNVEKWTQVKDASNNPILTNSSGAIVDMPLTLYNCFEGTNTILIANSASGLYQANAIYNAGNEPAPPDGVDAEINPDPVSPDGEVIVRVYPGEIGPMPDFYGIEAINAYEGRVVNRFPISQGGSECHLGGVCTFKFKLPYGGNYTIRARGENNAVNGFSEWIYAPHPVVLYLKRIYDANPPFKDIANNALKEDIIWVYKYGITTGTDATHYNPGGAVTRGQMAAFLWRAAGQPAIDPKWPSYKDAKAPFVEQIRWLVHTGITTGYTCTAKGKPVSNCTKKGEKVYQPQKQVTREQMAGFMYRLGLSPKTYPFWPKQFIDIDKSVFFSDIVWLKEMQITGGTNPPKYNLYQPKRVVTRAQMAAFMGRFVRNGYYDA
jgi:hypothetical protein